MSKHKILAVDDSQTILKILEMILTQAGYEVYTAEDGLEGINMAKEVKPDLVILDFIMPKMNGFQVCKALRKDNELKDVPIIVMSAKGEKVGDKFINIMGAIDYLTKPFSPEALLSLIPEVLKKIEAKRTATGSLPPIKPGEFKREFSTEQEVILNTIRNQVYTNFESVADTIMKTKSRAEIIEIISDVLSESLSEGLFEDLKIKFEKIISGSSTEAISMKGLLSQVPLPEVFQFAKFQNHTGMLKVTDVNKTAFVFIQGGTISFATFANPISPDFKENILDGSGLDEYLVKKALRLADSRNTTLIKTIVQEKMWDKTSLVNFLDYITREIVYEILTWKRGSFSFHIMEKHMEEIQEIDLGINLEQLVMDGLRRLDELREMQKVIHSETQVFVPEPGRPVDMSKLSRAESRVIPLLDGNKSIGDIKNILNFSTYEITRAFFSLLKKGFTREISKDSKTVNE